MGLNKAFLSARRPSKSQMTQSEKEEGLIPYEPNLPIVPKSILTYTKRVNNIRGIVVRSSYLESTSLVFAYGIDLFFTHIAPSSTFDLLNADFNYFALVATSVTLSLLTIISIWLSRKRDLSRAWK